MARLGTSGSAAGFPSGRELTNERLKYGPHRSIDLAAFEFEIDPDDIVDDVVSELTPRQIENRVDLLARETRPANTRACRNCFDRQAMFPCCWTSRARTKPQPRLARLTFHRAASIDMSIPYRIQCGVDMPTRRYFNLITDGTSGARTTTGIRQRQLFRLRWYPAQRAPP